MTQRYRVKKQEREQQTRCEGTQELAEKGSVKFFFSFFILLIDFYLFFLFIFLVFLLLLLILPCAAAGAAGCKGASRQTQHHMLKAPSSANEGLESRHTGGRAVYE